MEVPLSEVISAGGAIVATSFGASKLFFARLAKVEDRFSVAIERLSTTVQELDKRLAVNSCIINNFLEGCHGNTRNRGNKTTDNSD